MLSEAEKICNSIIEKCEKCKFAACEQCEINWNQVQAIKAILDLYNKEKEKREIAEENHKVLSLDIGQACKDLGLPEDTIIADELVLEINKRYISKDKLIELKEIDNIDLIQCKLRKILEE